MEEQMSEYGDPECSADRQRYVISEVKRLQGIADQQETLRKELVSRLSTVTSPEPPSTEADQPSESTGVPLADELSVVSRTFEVTNAILENILGRLEI
jgi:hypothetical protein